MTTPQAAAPIEARIDDWLEKAMTITQEFASAWATVDGPFDNGDSMEQAEASREELRQHLMLAASPPAQPTPADNWQQYAKPGETAQDIIERWRGDCDGLMALLAKEREGQAAPVGASQADYFKHYYGPLQNDAYFPPTQPAAKLDMVGKMKPVHSHALKVALLNLKDVESPVFSQRWAIGQIETALAQADAAQPAGVVRMLTRQEQLQALVAAINAGAKEGPHEVLMREFVRINNLPVKP